MPFLSIFKNTYSQVHTRNVRVGSLPKHYAQKKTRITKEDVNRAMDAAIDAFQKDKDSKYVSAQWDIAHEIFVHYNRQEKYLAEEKRNRDALDSYCELDPSSLECREYDF